jgi:transposase
MAFPRRSQSTRLRGHPIRWGVERSIVELVRQGQTPDELARQFEPSAQAIRTGVREADRNAGHRHDSLTSIEPEELPRLHRENCTFRVERVISSPGSSS